VSACACGLTLAKTDRQLVAPLMLLIPSFPRRVWSLLPLASVLVFGLVSARVAHGADRPNILWLTSEDHGPEMGCYGDPQARTPHVDALAARGMIFRHAWATHPVCAPARTAIVSGMYGHSTGGIHMRSMVPMPAGAKMFPELLRDEGYYASNNSKEDYNLPKTARTWDESSAQAHWRKRAPNQPFFAVFNSTKSHESQIRTRPHEAVADPAKMRVPSYHPDLPAVRQDWAQYYDKVSEADADAGVRLKELADDGLAEETIVFYYGDHGSGMPRSKRWPSNSGLQVPLVVYFPAKWRHLAPKEYQAGGKSDRLVSFVDLAPTVLSLAGIRPPDTMQGRAFAGPHQTTPPRYLFGARGRMDERQDLVRSVSDGRYVYLRNFFPHVSQAQRVSYQFETPTTRLWHDLFVAGKTTEAQSIFWRTPKAPEELYDLQTDWDEVRNLADSAQHRAILKQLRDALTQHLEQVRDVGFLPEGEMHVRSEGNSPYDLARDEAKYPFRRIFAAADLASRLEPAAIRKLRTLLADPDSAVRYWAALGFLMRGADVVRADQDILRRALTDTSPHVQIVAAEALALHGQESDLAPALTVLREYAAPEKHGVFVTMSALSAIEALGAKGQSLHAHVAAVRTDTGWPHPRFNSYVPQLITNITGVQPAARAEKAKGKGKGKKKAANP
jgi:arylsulfatase A-like enzyme